MRKSFPLLFLLLSLLLSAAPAIAQAAGELRIDPQTGRAIGAREISPDELRRHIDSASKMLLIDVREPEAFAKETIKGAINIPIEQLGSRLRDIPRDTILFFT